MQIHLEELTHQRQALDALLDAMPKLNNAADANIYANPLLQHFGQEQHFIDIKMETGTGKTYVYTRAMLELQQRLGLFKFIIIVPSLAIKQGAKNFIAADYARQHFARFFPNKRIALHSLNAGDFQGKKGRKAIPAALKQFCDASSNERNSVQCLLLSDKGFLDRKDSALFKNDYDQMLFGGFNCPIEALANTRPIVMLDEPHRFKREGKSYKNIAACLQPQMILRFGATFPKAKDKKIDYYRGQPQFDLGAVEAFNQDLVKGVDVQYPALPEDTPRYKVKRVSQKELVLTHNGKDYRLTPNDTLPGFDGGITYDGNKKLSNDLELHNGLILYSGCFADSYQDVLLRQALDAHFEIEAKNFHRQENGQGFKVKTLALFFIDSIASYRGESDWLKQHFEKLLRAKLAAMLKDYPSGAYHDFLRATQNDIGGAHGGYFSGDKNKKDEETAAEIEDILQKENVLSFKKANGDWNIRRFFFSKWTLREGWDNPNIFTICKLRSSGSEISKIQEVGRGLRLPVDEKGNRLSDQEWFLNFVIGWDEKHFAQKLQGEINADAKLPLNHEKLTAEMIAALCEARKIGEEELLERLDGLGIIKRNNDFKESGFEKLLQLYPELSQNRVKNGKITAPDGKKPKIKLRRENWEKIRHIWEKLVQRHMVVLERLGAEEIESLLAEVLADKQAFNNKHLQSVHHQTQKGEGEIGLTEAWTDIANNDFIEAIPYPDFVKKLAERSFIPIQSIHKVLWARLTEFSQEGLSKEEINQKLSQHSLDHILKLWSEKFAETYAVKYSYDGLAFTADTSVLKNGSFVEELAQGTIGIMLGNDIQDDKRCLYEPPFAYDTEPEHKIEKLSPPHKISVFGKIPRRAIKVPTYTGGSTTPDFIYVREAGDKNELALLLEVKAADMRMTDRAVLEAQKKFFKNLKNAPVQWELVTEPDEVSALMKNFAK